MAIAVEKVRCKIILNGAKSRKYFELRLMIIELFGIICLGNDDNVTNGDYVSNYGNKDDEKK